ncbi:hypothetical protein BU25DRAFT_58116 [Macroventuria anomochaeta]|uniref:Uncharacterized protein n=1 Tax=Macroventuria anomochaeta TaxID=301207 RepID=A0ACB6S074_9PLEO|nr:uncharacterized protein BU25DRAFT_58116 [Macroventuria anomochaeta]KAF2627681.1 hypothetical protein BU25DRAFT_58116 [Macroventuria anomochaeta]
MADREGSQEDTGECREVDQKHTKDMSSKQSPPPSDSMKLATYIASLDTEQRNAISEFIQATKEPVSVAIQTLQGCQWDLLEAVGRFGEDDEQEVEGNLHLSAPAIEPIRNSRTRESFSRRGPKRVPTRDTYILDSRSWRRAALYNSTSKNGKKNPQSPKSVIFDPVTLDYTHSRPNTPSAPMFISYYSDKLWYSGFMKP